MKTQNIGIKKAAQILGKSEQFVRVGLQKGYLPIGSAVKMSRNRWNYYISPKLLSDFTGYAEETEADNTSKS